jgi:hypothetical protein
VSADGFTFEQEDDHYTAHIVANAERVVDRGKTCRVGSWCHSFADRDQDVCCA